MTAQRYTAVAIVLHWAIALAILLMLPLGFWMHLSVEAGNTGQGVFQAFQLHKSIGLTILALSLVRLGWRLAHKPPPLPAGMPAWEAFAARATHWAFYFIIIAMPLSGWLYVSAQWSHESHQPLPVPTHWFGLFRVPNLFDLASQSHEVRAQAADAAFTAHYLMAYTAIALFVLHVAAALKHHFINRDETLAHMLPGLKAPNETEAPPKNAGRGLVLGVGLGATLVAICVAVFSAAGMVSAAASAPRVAPAAITAAAPTAPVAAATAPAAAVATTIDPPTASATPAASRVWRVDQRASSIGFGYSYIEGSDSTPFTGRFGSWTADIRFDPNDLAHASIVARINVASAHTGVEAHDGALPSPGWLNAAANPTAEFRSTHVTLASPGHYVAHGTLSLKGQSRPLNLPFTLTINGAHASAQGEVRLTRHDFGIGDPGNGDENISPQVTVTVRIEANRG